MDFFALYEISRENSKFIVAMATDSLALGDENNRSDFMLACPFSYLGV